MSEFDLQYWQELDKQIPGWLSEAEARFLIENVQGENYLEIGVAYGKSLRLIKHHYPTMQIGGIDKINHGVHDKVEGVRVEYGDANEIFRQVDDEMVDTLFIDGNHLRDGVLSDVLHWYNKVKPGGSIIFHDYKRDKNHEGVEQVVDFIKPLFKDFKSTFCICAMKK